MWNRCFALVAVGGLLLIACGGDGSSGTDTAAPDVAAQAEPEVTEPAVTEPEVTEPPRTSTSVPAPTTLAPDAGPGCEVLHGPGEYEGVGRFGEVEQPYWMVVPDSYSDVAPAPLYVMFPSGSGSRDQALEGMRPYVDGLNGLMLIVQTSDRQAVTPEALVSLIDGIGSAFCVDPEQIHAMGTAWAAAIAEGLACEASDRIASFVSAVGQGTTQACAPGRPVPLLTFTGDTDRTTVNAIVDRWTSINGCDPEPAVDDLGSGVLEKTFLDCDADVVFYDIQGMGHCFVTHEAKGPAAPFMCEYEEFDYLEGSYEFFAAHPLE